MSVVYEGKNIIGNLVVIRSEDKDGNRGFAFNCQPIIDDDTARALADAIYNDLGLGWLPYPENKPEDKEYFITTIDPTEKEPKHITFYATYSTKMQTWLSPFGGLMEDEHCKILAFMEPQPYEGE